MSYIEKMICDFMGWGIYTFVFLFKFENSYLQFCKLFRIQFIFLTAHLLFVYKILRDFEKSILRGDMVIM